MAELRNEDLLLNRFFKHAKEHPNDVYLIQPHDGGQVTTYTFSQVVERARKMAGYIQAQGWEPQSKIAIISKNCAHFFITDLAIWMAGHVSVALYPTLQEETVSYILEHSESKLLFVGKLDVWPELKRGVPEGLPMIGMPMAPQDSDYPRWDDVVKDVEPIEGTPGRGADDEALIIYTSGSTGKPKGVLHSFRTISTPTVGLVKMLNVTPEDRALSYLPLAHGMDRWLSECISLYVGNQVFFAEALDTFVQDLGRARPTIFVSVPRLWLKFQLGVFKKMPPKRLNLLLKIPIVSGIIKKKILGNLGLADCRFAGSGSAPIPADVLAWYRNLGLELLEGYGMSENFNYSHITVPGDGRPGYIGHPYPDVECKLSEAGEILVKSPGTMVCYYKDPEKTAEVMTEDGFLRTGDRGEIDSEGRLKITGRVKELFKTSKGKYVSPAPIENLFNNDPHIELSLVGGSGRVRTHAVVQLAEDLRPQVQDPAVRARITQELEALLAHVNSEIEEFEVVGFVVVAKDTWTVEDGLLTPTMKIKRSAIEDLYEAKLDAWYAAGKKVIWEE
ncbi:MAG: AMP-binding protein [Alphaproteobacteria bacterium]|nr:AMP-binding protein [Alphaproteobacteria bacterium]